MASPPRRKRNQHRLRALHRLREDRRERRGPTGAVKMTHSETDLSSKLVLDAEGIFKSFGDQPIIRDGWLRVLRGDRLAIVGPNGCGKTTLLKLFTGALAPDAGTAILGSNLQTVTLDQRREKLDPKRTLADSLTGGNGDQVTVGGSSRHVVGYMKDFLFLPEQAQTPVSVLSGGERGRLLLARALVVPSNLLVLDEPTNDLDLETLDLLQELLATYVGTILLVSHDRDFIDRVATSVLAAEGDGRWTEYAGGYSDMVAQRGHGFEPGPLTPKTRAGAAFCQKIRNGQAWAEAADGIQGKTRAGNPAWAHSGAGINGLGLGRGAGRPRSVPPRSRTDSRTRRTDWKRPRRGLPRRKTSGSDWRRCAKSWSLEDKADG